LKTEGGVIGIFLIRQSRACSNDKCLHFSFNLRGHLELAVTGVQDHSLTGEQLSFGFPLGLAGSVTLV
jgi:hypothetical protein